ncbi:MAG: response regulator [Candidatus Eremiobacteraeota bacterium]|nr:response regulator [Candidatus Eremiobacteraeota bacterium]
MRVLLVDDNTIDRKVVARMLDGLGHEVVQSRNGLDALHCLETERVDAVVMDLLMPMLNGLETMEQIRKHEGNRLTPVIVLSAAGPGVAKDCLQAGAAAYLEKPCSPQELARELARGV